MRTSSMRRTVYPGTQSCPVVFAFLQLLKIYMGMEGTVLQSDTKASLSLGLRVSCPLTFLGRVFIPCWHSVARRHRLLLCGLSFFFIIVAEGADSSFEAGGAQVSPNCCIFETSPRKHSQPVTVKTTASRLPGQRSLQMVDDDSTADSSSGATEDDPHEGSNPCAREGPCFAFTGGSRPQEERALRSYQLNNSSKRGKHVNASGQVNEEIRSRSPPSPYPSFWTPRFMEARRSGCACESASAGARRRSRTQSLLWRPPFFMNSARSSSSKVVPASRKTLRKYVAKLPPETKNKIFKWLPGLEPRQSTWEKMADFRTKLRDTLKLLRNRKPESESGQRMLAHILQETFGPVVLEGEWSDPKIQMRKYFCIPRRKAYEDENPFLIDAGSGVSVRSNLSGKVYNITVWDTLGNGGEGTIFAARSDVLPLEDVAVKVPYRKAEKWKTPDYYETMFTVKIIREAAPLYTMPGNLDSKRLSDIMHIVLPWDVVTPTNSDNCPGQSGSTVYSCTWLLMQRFCSSLADLRQSKVLTRAEMLSATRQMILAVAVLHSTGLLHNDIKSGNFLVSTEGDVYLADFGLATSQDKLGSCAAGTMSYMAPEKLRCISEGRRMIVMSKKLDSWSLGVTLFRLWCNNRHPFLTALELQKRFSGEHPAAAHYNAIEKRALMFRHCGRHIPAEVKEAIEALLVFRSVLRSTPEDVYYYFALFWKSFEDILA